MLRPILILLSCILLFSCTSSKNAAVTQQAATRIATKIDTLRQAGLFEARIKPKDLLSITTTSGNQGYLVENDGTIYYPTKGQIHVAGLTRPQVAKLIQPEASLRISNYSVSVLGEVNRPGNYLVSNERMSIFDALAQAGDVTQNARQDNIKVLREHADGRKEIIQINLYDGINTLNSPVYYLEQNDVVTVESILKRKPTQGFKTTDNIWITVISTLISVASLVVNITR